MRMIKQQLPHLVTLIIKSLFRVNVTFFEKEKSLWVKIMKRDKKPTSLKLPQ
jgi:hypothetical protein